MKALTVITLLLVCVASAQPLEDPLPRFRREGPDTLQPQKPLPPGPLGYEVELETIMRIESFPQHGHWDFEEWETDTLNVLYPSGWIRKSGYPERVALPYHGRYGMRGISSTIWTDKIDLYYPGDSMFRAYVWTLNRHVQGKIEAGVMRLDFYFMGEWQHSRHKSIWTGEWDKWEQQGWLYWFDIGKLYPVDQVRFTLNIACSLYYDCGIFEVMYPDIVGIGEGRGEERQSRQLPHTLTTGCGHTPSKPLRLITPRGVLTRFQGDWYDITGRKVKVSSHD